MAKIHNIIVAAGSGSRFGGPLPKQFMPLGGVPVVVRAILALRAALPNATDTIVISAGEIDRWNEICGAVEPLKSNPPRIAIGGKSRFESVRNAISTIEIDTDIVLIHDGARPFPSCRMIHSLVESALQPDINGAIPTVPVTDSLRRILTDGRSECVERSEFRSVQTPQAFRFDHFCQAYSMTDNEGSFTDDASVMEAAGYGRLKLVDGNPYNIKITNPADIAVAEVLLQYI